MVDIQVAQPLQRAMDVDRVVEPHAAQLGDHPLRLAQRIGTDQHTAFGLGAQRGEELVDLVGGFGMAEDGEAEGRFGHEHVAFDRAKGFAGGIGAALVIARDDDALTAMIEHDLCRAEDMAGGDEADLDVPRLHGFAIGDRAAGLRAVARLHDRQRFGSRPHRAMPAARVVGMAVGDEGAGLGL